MAFEAGLLVTLFLVGGICSLSDCRKHIIPNRYLFSGLCVGAAFHVGNALTGSLHFYAIWLANLGIATLLSMLMYFAKLWAAGDAKLFITLYFCLPPRILDGAGFSMAIIPFFFVFLLAYVWVIADSVWRLFKKEPKKGKPINISAFLVNYGITIVETTALYSIFLLILPEFIRNNALLSSIILVAYAFVCNSHKWSKKWYTILVHGMVLLFSYCLRAWAPTIPDWRNALIILLAVALQHYASLYDYQLVPTSSIRSGMILSAEAVIQFRLSKVRDLPTNPTEEITARITDTEAEAVRRWGRSAKGTVQIWIVRKTPFAIMITLGFAVWVAYRLLR